MAGCLGLPMAAIIATLVVAVQRGLADPAWMPRMWMFVGGGAAIGVGLAVLNMFWMRTDTYQRTINIRTGEATPWKLVRSVVDGPFGGFIGFAVLGASMGLLAVVWTGRDRESLRGVAAQRYDERRCMVEGDMSRCYEAANAYRLGILGDVRDVPRAFQLYHRICDSNIEVVNKGAACHELAELYLDSAAGTPRPDEALAIYERRCRLDGEACRRAAEIYLRDRNGQKDFAKSSTILSELARHREEACRDRPALDLGDSSLSASWEQERRESCRTLSATHAALQDAIQAAIK